MIDTNIVLDVLLNRPQFESYEYKMEDFLIGIDTIPYTIYKCHQSLCSTLPKRN